MVGEPYHGGDFMTLTQRAKEQQVPMTEEPLGGKMGKAKIPGIFFVVDYWILLIITRYWWIIGGLLVDDWWMIGYFGLLLDSYHYFGMSMYVRTACFWAHAQKILTI